MNISNLLLVGLKRKLTVCETCQHYHGYTEGRVEHFEFWPPSEEEKAEEALNSMASCGLRHQAVPLKVFLGQAVPKRCPKKSDH